MEGMTRRSLLKLWLLGASVLAVPFSSKWAKASTKCFDKMLHSNPMTEDQFYEYLLGVLRKNKDVIGDIQHLEAMRNEFNTNIVMQGIIKWGDKSRYFKQVFSEKVKWDKKLRDVFTNKMIESLRQMRKFDTFANMICKKCKNRSVFVSYDKGYCSDCFEKDEIIKLQVV